MTSDAINRAQARALDADDPLSDFSDRLVVTDPDLIYADGNSLGRLPSHTVEVASDLVTTQWGDRLIRGWNEHWLDGPERLGAKIADLIGAGPDEVIVADSTTVNFFKLAVAALRHQQGRRGVVSDDLNFPSDLHSLSEAVDLLDKGHRIELVRSADGMSNTVEDIAAALDGDTALLTLSHVVFKSGYLYDMAAVTAAAHRVGALTLWDLSHSAGSVDVRLNEAGADLAVGCTYKYLNGGPGAPAFLYVRRDLQDALRNPLAGWMGRKQMFDFDLDFEPESGMRRFLTGTPYVVSMALIEPGVDLLRQAGIGRLRAKSVALGEFFAELWRQRLEPLGYRFQSPVDSAQRGSQVSLGHDEGLAIDLALINDLNVIPDFRSPDNIRVGFAPLYTSFEDVYELVERLERVVVEERFVPYRDASVTVT